MEGHNQIDPTLDIEAEIHRLRQDRDAIILAHYYQDGEIQDLADFVGDSLDLSRTAAATDADVIVFCGVRFMAETAKILNPDKTVLLPDMDAGCSLEQSCQPDAFRQWRDQHPGHVAVTYVNCSAEVKALSDICVTSSNAEQVIRSIPSDQPILFAPDRHMGAYLSRKTGREMVLWPGTCLVHEQFSAREITRLQSKYPDAKIAAHPECPQVILDLAEHIGSTRSILDYVTNANTDAFIIATERHIIHQMKKACPDKTFIEAPGADGSCNCANCPYMDLNTMEKLYIALRDQRPEIILDSDLCEKALLPLERMLTGTISPIAAQNQQTEE